MNTRLTVVDYSDESFGSSGGRHRPSPVAAEGK
jgi:hypothetical protein